MIMKIKQGTTSAPMTLYKNRDGATKQGDENSLAIH